MKCLVFDRGDGVIGIGLKIQFGGIDQFSIVWPDRPSDRFSSEILETSGVRILGESELSEPMDPPSVVSVDPNDPVDLNAGAVTETISQDLVPSDPIPLASDPSGMELV